MQAKMEPGCINGFQVSPTVQATKSNYTQVHKGKLPAYVEYFLENDRASRTFFKYLQSEQTTRFLGKRNLNILIDVEEDIPVQENFKWLTLSEIKSFYHMHNLVNMNTRSILACIDPFRFASADAAMAALETSHPQEGLSRFQIDLYRSRFGASRPLHELEEILSWLADLKTRCFMEVKKIALDRMRDWQLTSSGIHHTEGQYFSVVGVEVSADREVNSWDQPVVAQPSRGLAGLIGKKIGGLYHFLFQAKCDPGNLDVLQLAPTVSCSVPEYRKKENLAPPFLDCFIDGEEGGYVLDTVLSEEGGRFYYAENEYRIRIIDAFDETAVPANFIWISYPQIYDLVIHGYFNIEARTLISYLI